MELVGANHVIRTMPPRRRRLPHTRGDMMIPSGRPLQTPPRHGTVTTRCRSAWGAGQPRIAVRRNHGACSLLGLLGRRDAGAYARVPRCTASYVQVLEFEAGEGWERARSAHCLAEAAHARCSLQDQLLYMAHSPRRRSPAPPVAPGEADWPHGWQYHASQTLTVHCRDAA